MNLNNLENLKEELKALAFKDKVISEMEKNMEKGIPEFTLSDHVAGARGQVDLTLHFKQSGQSEYYYFNKTIGTDMLNSHQFVHHKHRSTNTGVK